MVANGGCRELGAGRPPGPTRTLRPLEVIAGPTGAGEGGRPFVAAVLDVETTGRSHRTDAVIELAVRRIAFDRQGVITEIGAARSWLEEPSGPLDPEISQLTGLTDDMLAGMTIDEEAAVGLLAGADVIVAHNAGFDRTFVEGRLHGLPRKPWACSMLDVDWPSLGFDGRKLGHLLMQCGLYHEPHRAVDDVDAVIGLLQHALPGGGTILGHMLARARRPTWLVRAYGAHYDAKDMLQARGYRWNSLDRHWMRMVGHDELEAEREWLDREVYCARMQPRGKAPWIEEIDWTTRYRG